MGLIGIKVSAIIIKVTIFNNSPAKFVTLITELSGIDL
jgi:hypothetical protein